MPRGSRLLVSRKDSGADLSLMLNFSLSDPSDFFRCTKFSKFTREWLEVAATWMGQFYSAEEAISPTPIHLQKPKGVGPAYSHLLCCQCFPGLELFRCIRRGLPSNQSGLVGMFSKDCSRRWQLQCRDGFLNASVLETFRWRCKFSRSRIGSICLAYVVDAAVKGECSAVLRIEQAAQGHGIWAPS